MHASDAAVAAAVSPAPTALRPAAGRAWLTVGLLIVAIVVAFIDRQLMVLLVDPIKAAFAVTDTQIAVLYGVAFALFSALAAVPAGKLIDRRNRMRILAAAVAFWSSMTVISGLATSYEMMFASRIGLGIGEAVIGPAVLSLMGDLFEGERRTRANLVMFGGQILAGSVGLGAAAGLVAWLQSAAPPDGMESWRLTFLWVAIPGFALSLIFLLMPEPARSGSTTTRTARAPTAALRHIAQDWRTFVLALAGIGFISTTASSALMWLPTQLIRALSMGAAEAGGVAAIILGLGSVAGVAAAGIGTALVGNTPHQSNAFKLTSIMCAGAVVAVVAIGSMAATEHALVVLGCFGLLFIGNGVVTGMTLNLLQELSPPQMRGEVMAWWGMAMLLFVIGGPIAVARVAEAFDGRNDALLRAFIVVSLPCLLLGLLALVSLNRAFKRRLPA